MHTCLAILPLLLSACQGPGPRSAVELEAAEVVLPMDTSTGHVAVLVRINGGEPLLFQVDTYASIDACIDDDVAEELGLQTVGTTMNSDGRTTRERRLVRIETLECGGATFRNLRTLVDDYDWIQRPDGKRMAGLLGFTAFRDLLLTFDYPGEQLVLRRGRLDRTAPHVIPFTSSSGAPDIELLVDGRSLRFGIDTGFGSALLMRRADAEELELDGELRVVGKQRSVYREYDIWGSRLAGDVGLAGHSIPTPELLFMEDSSLRLVGHAAFKEFAMTFDQAQRLVAFERPSAREVLAGDAADTASDPKAVGDRR